MKEASLNRNPLENLVSLLIGAIPDPEKRAQLESQVNDVFLEHGIEEAAKLDNADRQGLMSPKL